MMILEKVLLACHTNIVVLNGLNPAAAIPGFQNPQLLSMFFN